MTLVFQRIIGRAAIADPVAGKIYPVGPGFELPEHKRHRETYTSVQAQEVADWLNGNDRPLAIADRSVDPFDPVNRRWTNAPRKGLTPLPDSK